MKRDLDLIRKLLIEIEAHQEPFSSRTLVIDGFDGAEIAYHVALIEQAGFVVARPLRSSGCLAEFHISALTFAGHDYLDAIRSPRVWQRVKDTAAQAGVSLSVEIAKDIALRITRQIIGEI